MPIQKTDAFHQKETEKAEIDIFAPQEDVSPPEDCKKVNTK